MSKELVQRKNEAKQRILALRGWILITDERLI
jgi:hypothetical protein